jgi:hypothetical protein
MLLRGVPRRDVETMITTLSTNGVRGDEMKRAMNAVNSAVSKGDISASMANTHMMQAVNQAKNQGMTDKRMADSIEKHLKSVRDRNMSRDMDMSRQKTYNPRSGSEVTGMDTDMDTTSTRSRTQTDQDMTGCVPDSNSRSMQRKGAASTSGTSSSTMADTSTNMGSTMGRTSDTTYGTSGTTGGTSGTMGTTPGISSGTGPTSTWGTPDDTTGKGTTSGTTGDTTGEGTTSGTGGGM